MFTTKLEVGLVFAVLALVAILGYGLYERHAGKQGCENANTAVANTAVATNTRAEGTEHAANAAEEETRAQNLSTPVAATPTVPSGLQSPPEAPRCRPAPAAGSAPGAGAPAPDVRAAGAPGMVLEDADAFIRSDVQRSHDADVEIRDRNQLLENLYQLCTARQK